MMQNVSSEKPADIGTKKAITTPFCGNYVNNKDNKTHMFLKLLMDHLFVANATGMRTKFVF